MADNHANDPLHGVTLKAILEDLVARRGWDGLEEHVRVRCFAFNPSINSSLKFLRRTPWARRRIEELYIGDQESIRRFADRG